MTVDSGMPNTHAAMVRRRTPAAGDSLPRVVLILATYIPESYGGAEQQSRKLALALGRMGMEVKVLAPRLRLSTPKREQDGPVTLRRFWVRRAPNLGGRHMVSFVCWAAKLFWWLVVHRREYDLLHIIHGRLHAVPAVIAGALLGKPALIKIGRGGSEHFDLDVVNRKKVLGPAYARMLVRLATGYIANSREIVDDLLRWGVPGPRIHRIPNGVDLRAAPARRHARPLRFVYLGRLDPEKAIDLMIQGFARLQDRSRASLTILGDGLCEKSLRDLVERLELKDTVTLIGPRSDVGPALADADVFVSTSLSEGMSNALLESMSFGVVPLVSRVSGVAEIVEDGRSGLLFPPGDLEGFIARLEDTISLSPEALEAYASAALKVVTDRFGIDQVAAQHVTLYRELVGDVPSAPSARQYAP